MLECHQGNLLDGDVTGAESPLLVLRICGFIFHFLARVQGSSAPEYPEAKPEGQLTWINKLRDFEMSVASFARVIGRRVFRQSFVLIYGRGGTVSLLFRVGKPRGERTWRLQDLYPGHCGAHQPT